MTIKQRKQIIKNKVEMLNELTGENYTYDYVSSYGGYQMYIIGENGRQFTGWLGFHGRYKPTEFIAYLDGLLNMHGFANVFPERWYKKGESK